jgi:hypothetical protein
MGGNFSLISPNTNHMSIFLRIERYGQAPRLLHLRHLFETIGEDSNGLIACGSPEKPFFTIHSGHGSYFLSLKTQAALLDDQPCPLNQPLPIKDQAILKGFDARFLFFCTKPPAEVLAYSSSSLNPNPSNMKITVPVVTYHTAGITRAWPLLCNTEIVVGCAPSCAVCLNFSGIAPRHCALNYNGSFTTIRALDGQLESAEGENFRWQQVTSDTRFRLAPGGLELALSQ